MSLDVVMLIGVVLPWRDALLEDFFFSLQEILSLGRKRNKMLLHDQQLKLGIGQ